MSTVSFPGLGIGEFSFSKTAFTLFGRSVAWYGIILTLGIIAAFIYVYLRTKKQGLVFDDLLDIAFFTVIPAIICARLYYVIFYELEHPGTYKTFKDVIAVWEGGIAVYGSIIGGAIGAFCVLKFKKIRVAQFFDSLGPSVMLGQIIGRWGNFVNSEAYGTETALPWRMGVIENGEMIYVHPTFLYESLGNLIGFILIMIFYKKRKFDGEIVLWYFTWYGVVRMLVEGLRTDSLYIGKLRVSQLIGFLCFALGLAAIIFFRIKYKKRHIARIIYHKNSKHYIPLSKETDSEKKETEALSDTVEASSENSDDADSTDNTDGSEDTFENEKDEDQNLGEHDQ